MTFVFWLQWPFPFSHIVLWNKMDNAGQDYLFIRTKHRKVSPIEARGGTQERIV